MIPRVPSANSRPHTWWEGWGVKEVVYADTNGRPIAGKSSREMSQRLMRYVVLLNIGLGGGAQALPAHLPVL